MMKYRNLLVIATLAAVAAACGDAPTTVVQDDGPAIQAGDAQALALGMNADYARIAEEVPGFGGSFVDDRGRTVVHMAGRDLATEGDQIRNAVRDRLPARPGRVGGPLMADAQPEIVLRDGAFDWSSLMDIHARAGGTVFGLGAVYTDIDETSNRVTIGIEAGASEAEFRRALEAQGIPAEAIRFTITPPIEALKGQTLQDRLQPLGGGAQLIFPYPPDPTNYVYLCTLGFNASMDGPGRSDMYFFTNSHCTFDQGAYDGTPYYQHALALPDEKYQIATEVVDPAYFTCYETYDCRYSDASLAQYRTTRTPVNFGGIHRPEEVNTGSVDIENEGPKAFTIVDEAPYAMVGDLLGKVGRTTGWTRGEVFASCVDVGQSGTNFAILCQDLVFANVGGGDSGSPVFMQHGESNDVTLYGILWGGGPGVFVYSPMENIRYEFDDFETH